MYSRQPLVVFPRLLRRVSQFPRRIFPCALSPSTPESPVVSFSRCFHHRWPASPCFGRLAVFHPRHEAESGLLSLRLAGSPPEAPSNGLLRFTLVRLHVERVIHMVDSFHSTRFASLLAHQSSQRKPILLCVPLRLFASFARNEFSYKGNDASNVICF